MKFNAAPDDFRSAQTLYQQAEAYYRQGKFPEAIALCHQAIALQPDLAIAYKTLGEILQARGQISEAIRSYFKALEIQPNLAPAEVHFNLGNSLADRDLLDEAIIIYRNALQLNPNYTAAYVNLGTVFRKQGKIEEAIRYYQQAIAIDPNFFAAYFSLGNALLHQKHFEAAIAAYIDTLLIKPDFEPAYFNLSHTLTQLNRIGDAFACALHLLPTPAIEDFYPSLLESYHTSPIHQHSPLKFIPIHPKIPLRLSRPKTLDTSFHSQFKWQLYINPETFVTLVPDARAWGDAYTTAVITADDRLLEEVSQGSPLLIVSSKKLPPATDIDGNVAFLSVRGGQTYYHWMADLLPRIQLLRHSQIDLADIDVFVVNSCNLPYQKETLNLLGISAEKIVESARVPHIKAKRLIVPSLPGDVGLIAKWSCNFLRQAFLTETAIANHAEPASKRLYISRKNASYRRVVNEDELVQVLSQYRFVRVSLESLSFTEQVSLFAAAEVVIAPHGAGLTNTVFCNPGTQIIELFAHQSISVNYWLLANTIGLEYYYLIGDRLENYDRGSDRDRRRYNHPIYEDIFISLDALLNLMQFAGIH